ncbi:hypothetical protein [Symbiopectobacterium sp. RP]
MITANALICGKKIQLIVIKIMSLGYTLTLLADYTPEELAHLAMVVFNPL